MENTMLESINNALVQIDDNMPGVEILENENMSGHCSFKIGGPVRAYIAPKDIWDMSKVFYYLHMNNIYPFMLGKGTNILIPDEGLDICVVSTENLQGIRMGETENTIYAEAGVSLARVAQFAQQNGLAGLEFASGIPGSVGGGTLMNAGAYGGEMKDVIESVVVYYLPDQALCEVKGEDCGFAYRHSNFEQAMCAILGVVFKLTPDEPEAILARMNEMNEKRRKSQPLDMPSAGSAFKRPVGGYAAALIEEAGLKGYSVGGAQVSEKHSGFVVNKGGASYDDVVELMEQVRRIVHEKSQITLEPEIRIYPKGMLLLDDWRRRKQGIMEEMGEMAKAKVEESKKNKEE